MYFVFYTVFYLALGFSACEVLPSSTVGGTIQIRAAIVIAVNYSNIFMFNMFSHINIFLIKTKPTGFGSDNCQNLHFSSSFQCKFTHLSDHTQ